MKILPADNTSIISEMSNATGAHAAVAAVEHNRVGVRVIADHAFVDILRKNWNYMNKARVWLYRDELMNLRTGRRNSEFHAIVARQANCDRAIVSHFDGNRQRYRPGITELRDR